MKKILCLTGSRADYGYLRPVMRKIKENEDLELIIVATGMHFFKEFGYTIEEIKKEFPEVIEAPLELPCDSGYGTSEYVAEGIKTLAKIFKKFKPDFCLFLGDRTEIFAGVQAAAYQNIPIIHMHGGDRSAGIDELIRYSITRFAHIHFPATEKSAERIIKTGEQPWRVRIVGSSTLDEILSLSLPEKSPLFLKYNLNPNEPLILIVQHPVTFQEDQAAEQMKITIEAVLKTKLQCFIIYPNSDPGGQAMINIIKDYEKENLKAKASLPREDYLGLLKFASVLVGNSSSGMIESSSFKIPVVNIGIRQENRERGKNVIDIGHNENNILEAINFVLTDKKFRGELKDCKNPYGDGHTGEKICEILKKIEIDKKLLEKKIIF